VVSVRHREICELFSDLDFEGSDSGAKYQSAVVSGYQIRLNVIFGYDLRVEPIKGTDEIRCAFSVLTDPDELPEKAWARSKDIPVVAVAADPTPLLIKSGDVIAITTLPFGPGKIAAVHYLRLTRKSPNAPQSRANERCPARCRG
jgi:hypothetical protein